MEQLLETEKKILASGIEINYLANEFLFRQGQKAEFVFYLQGGSVLLEWPQENKCLVLNNKSIFIGIDEAIHGSKYFCTAVTTDESKFLVFDRAYFIQLMNEFEHANDYFESMKLEFISQLDLLTAKVTI